MIETFSIKSKTKLSFAKYDLCVTIQFDLYSFKSCHCIRVKGDMFKVYNSKNFIEQLDIFEIRSNRHPIELRVKEEVANLENRLSFMKYDLCVTI